MDATYVERLLAPVQGIFHQIRLRLANLKAVLVPHLDHQPSPDTEAARRVLDNATRTLETLEKDVSTDYGKDGIFRALKGKCVSRTTGEYTYEMCHHGRISQTSNRGGAPVSLGYFRAIDIEPIDPRHMPTLPSGLDQPRVRTTLRFDDGQSCWNGPRRRTAVTVVCSAHDELISVAEEEMCVYRFVVGSPVVCVESEPVAAAHHDEL